MGLFNDPRELERKQKLKELEDKRLRFAEEMQKAGFTPEYMLMVSTDRGGFIGLCRHKGELCAVVGPDFGSGDDFTLERLGRPEIRREEYFEPAEGMGGAFGFGKKGQTGFNLIIECGEKILTVPFIVNRNSAMECKARNPLLSAKRRRGDANIVWDMQPMDKRLLAKLERKLNQLLA